MTEDDVNWYDFEAQFQVLVNRFVRGKTPGEIEDFAGQLETALREGGFDDVVDELRERAGSLLADEAALRREEKYGAAGH
jgi:hypothetical protein